MTKSTIELPAVRRWHSPNGYRPVLIVKRGRKHLHVLALKGGKVRVVRLAVLEESLMRPLVAQGKPYPVARAIKQVRFIARARGATGEAQAWLDRL